MAERPVALLSRSWRPVIPTRAELTGLAVGAAAPFAVLAATGWWLVEVTRSWAGRDAPSVTVGALLVAVAVAVVRPHRVLPAAAVVAATAISVGAFAVAALAPTGWTAAPGAAGYVCGAWLALTVAALVRERPELQVWFVTAVVASAPVEFLSGWLGWWGGRDPARPMVGTFYWHNPYAAFLVPGAVVGLALWTWRERLFALLGIMAFVIGTVGIVYSTSRASLATLGIGVAAMALMAAAAPGRLRALRQVVLAAALAAAAAYAIGGPPFFPHRASPLAGEQARAAGQSLGQNGSYRLDFWREALTVFGRHPVTGGGYKSMVRESVGHVPQSWPLSPYAHNGYLQSLSDGGLLLGLPFLAATAAVVVLCVRALWRAGRERRAGVAGYAVPVALGCVLLHSVVDFDWTYAADFALTAVLAGMVVGRQLGAADRRERRAGARLALVGCLVVGLGALGLTGWVMRNGDHVETLLPSATATR